MPRRSIEPEGRPAGPRQPGEASCPKGQTATPSFAGSLSWGVRAGESGTATSAKPKKRRFNTYVWATLALVASSECVAAAELDPSSGLIIADSWQLVRGHCTACHSAKLVTQQSGDAKRWLGLIRWMQETQGLWQFDQQTESKIITYLATNYPPTAKSRRPPLRPHEMPANSHH